MKENKLGGIFVGFLYKIVIPKFIKGLVKSTAFWRADVIVKSVMPKSALWNKINLNQIIRYIIFVGFTTI